MDEILRAGTSFQFCIKVSQSKFLCMLVGAGAARGVFVGIFKVKDFFVRVFLGVLSISYVSQANILQIASVHLPYLLTHPRTMICLEQKLFWVFWFKSFKMLIEIQIRVVFFNNIVKLRKNHNLCCKSEATQLDIESKYSIKKALSWCSTFGADWGRCLTTDKGAIIPPKHPECIQMSPIWPPHSENYWDFYNVFQTHFQIESKFSF